MPAQCFQIRCFQIHATDNVATLLQDAAERAEVQVTGEGVPRTLLTAQAVCAGHKLAVRPIARGEAILKYGFPVGEARQPIAEGEWVHLHNCSSLYDARSAEADVDSGLKVETRYA